MAELCKSFDSWLATNLSDSTEAAYFLSAALEDAIESKDIGHFVSALKEVGRATNQSFESSFGLMFKHIKPEDLPSVEENISILFVKMLSEKDRPPIPV
jgi:hypothetical protein